MYTQALITQGTPDPAKARCYDCYHCQAAVSWWCKNELAIKWRGTSLPGVRFCPFWLAANKKENYTAKQLRQIRYIDFALHD